MNIEHFWYRNGEAIENRRSVLPMVALAILALSACTPSSPDDDAEQPADATAVAAPEEPVAQVSQLDALLDRLGEPSLADNCAADTTTYRIARLEWERGAAAVRVFSGPDGRGYRSVFSEALGRAISSDGWLDERRWDRIDREFDLSGIWDIASDAFAEDYQREGVLFVEACKDGIYHHLQSDPRNEWLSGLVAMLSRIGKLQWLETGRRDFSFN